VVHADLTIAGGIELDLRIRRSHRQNRMTAMPQLAFNGETLEKITAGAMSLNPWPTETRSMLQPMALSSRCKSSMRHLSKPSLWM
jgi:hypothetical protein